MTNKRTSRRHPERNEMKRRISRLHGKRRDPSLRPEKIGTPFRMTRVMVFGTFDIFHPGHKNFLEQAKKFGHHLTVIIARDRTVKEVKGKLPKNKENVRLKKVQLSGLALEVILGNLSDKYAVIRKHKPDVIALGYDQRNFTRDLAKTFPKVKIVKLKAFKPEVYKSSLINQRHKTNRHPERSEGSRI